jgi:hypothetical protein
MSYEEVLPKSKKITNSSIDMDSPFLMVGHTWLKINYYLNKNKPLLGGKN